MRLRRGVLHVGVIAALVASAACAGVDIATGNRTDDPSSGTPGRSGGATGTSTTPTSGAALVGRWSHVLYLEYADAVQTSETLWTFDAQGVVTRVVTTADLTDGYSATEIAQGRWSASGTTVTITFTAPRTGTVSFAYRVETGSLGTTLFLDSTSFVKVVP